MVNSGRRLIILSRRHILPAASLIESKLLLNTTISQSAQGAQFMTLDIKNFFLQTIMDEQDFVQIQEKNILQKNLNNCIICKYISDYEN